MRSSQTFTSLVARTGTTCAIVAVLVLLGGDGRVRAQATPTDTPTNTPTNTPTDTPTDTPTNTPTDTPTDTPTNTPTNTPTDTPTNTPSGQTSTPVPGCSPVATPSTLPDGAINVPYSQLLTASGGTDPYTFAVVAGSLPPGLNLDPGGQISGTPTATGPFAFTVRITDSAATPCSSDQPFDIEILAAVRTTPPTFLLLLAVMLGLAAWLALRRPALR